MDPKRISAPAEEAISDPQTPSPSEWVLDALRRSADGAMHEFGPVDTLW